MQAGEAEWADAPAQAGNMGARAPTAPLSVSRGLVGGGRGAATLSCWVDTDGWWTPWRMAQRVRGHACAAAVQVLTRPLRLAGEVDFAAVAARTPGFVGADLAALAKEAAALAVRRIFAQLEQARARGCGRDSVPA